MLTSLKLNAKISNKDQVERLLYRQTYSQIRLPSWVIAVTRLQDQIERLVHDQVLDQTRLQLGGNVHEGT